jgi:hypothetical protein
LIFGPSVRRALSALRVKDAKEAAIVKDRFGSKAEVQKRRAPAAICLSPAAIEFPGKETGKALSV